MEINDVYKNKFVPLRYATIGGTNKKSLAMAGYVDMKLDYSFKKAFSDKEQLCAFLNDMLRGERVVKKVEPRNPEWLPPSPRQRKIRNGCRPVRDKEKY